MGKKSINVDPVVPTLIRQSLEPDHRVQKAHMEEDKLNSNESATPGVGTYSPRYSSAVSGRSGIDFGSNKTEYGAYFGTSSRPWQMRENGGIPGPGQYDNQPSLAAQVESERASAARTKFGTAKREQINKLYLSEAHNRVAVNEKNPGPGAYELQSSVGQQQSSGRCTAPAPRFGTAGRDKIDKMYISKAHSMQISPRTPGPGSYVLECATGLQVSSLHGNAPSGKMGQGVYSPKMYVSAEHARAGMGQNSPGPVYLSRNLTIEAGSNRVKRGASLKRNGVTTFGGSSRLAKTPAERASEHIPGPSMYYQASSLGTQHRGQSSPRFSFGTSTRTHRAKMLPTTLSPRG